MPRTTLVCVYDSVKDAPEGFSPPLKTSWTVYPSGTMSAPQVAQGVVEGEVVDSCPPCSVCDVNAVAILSTSLPLLPEFSGKVEEQLRLRRDVAEPGRRPKGDAVGPLDVLEPRIRLMLDLGAVPAPVLLRGDEQLLVQLRDVAQPTSTPADAAPSATARASRARCRGRCST
jgi:hypothetical protein